MAEPSFLPWAIRVSRRARRLSVRVFHSGRVEVVVPPRVSARAIEQFVSRHRAWIERKHLASLSQRPCESFPPRQITLAASSERWTLELTSEPSKFRVDTTGSILRICAQEGPQEICRLLRRWVVKRAQVFLSQELSACAASIGAQYRRATIRCQRTRWGSCSRSGTISLNACAMFQRPDVMRYLLVHELAHLTHMNHSQRFWAYVERFVPEYPTLDRELRDGWRHVPYWFDAGIAAL